MSTARMAGARIDPGTLAQIDALDLAARPLVVCDVDEVVVRFVAAFEAHLHRHDHWLDARSFALTGNIRRRADNVAVDADTVHGFLRDFFDTRTAHLDPVPGAPEALGRLAGAAQIVMLTNIPHGYRAERMANLARHGLTHPVVTNEGAKGPAVALLAERTAGPLFFLDDSPMNIRSVLREVPRARVIHFLADPRLAALAEEVEGTHLRTGAWDEARAFIEAALHAAAAGADT